MGMLILYSIERRIERKLETQAETDAGKTNKQKQPD